MANRPLHANGALDEWSHSSLDCCPTCRREQATARAVRWRRRWTPSARLGVHGDPGDRGASREQSLHDEVFGRMTPEELMNNVIALTMRDERSAALELVRKAVGSVRPGWSSPGVGVLLIPECPGDAERRLVSMRGRMRAVEGLITACWRCAGSGAAGLMRW